MPIPLNAKPGDFLLVSFDGKNPNISDPKKWAMNGGLIRIGRRLLRSSLPPFAFGM